jgi:hypothetical protein
MNLMDRILPVFERNYPLETRATVWERCMSDAMQVELTEANFENMCGTALVSGFGGGGGLAEIVKLAQALGVYGITNPENNAYHGREVPSPANADLTPDELLDRIQARLPFTIDFPEFSGNCQQGLETKYGVTSNRHIFYLWVLKRIIELYPDRDSSIIEIGAGFGLLGYYLDRAGYRDYTTIDLALVNACQTYFLARNLSSRNFILSGDVADPFDRQYRDSIKLLHASDFHDIPAQRFSIMINMDGLTEMGPDQATRYVQSDCAADLFSINHEVNPFRVCELEQARRRLMYRYPFWLREGYVEELWMPGLGTIDGRAII